MRRGTSFLAAILLAALVGCGGKVQCVGPTCNSVDASADTSVDASDASADADADATAPCNGPPGLYTPGSCTTLAPLVRPYAPAYVLWSDGAAKTRYVYLPPGATIDTSNPDAWVYPQGTRLYKHFDFGGHHIETRLLEKTGTGEGPSAWSFRTFQWNYAQDSVTEITNGATNVLGTQHDIPPTSACPQCHASGGGGASATSGMRDISLSFTAIQLNHANTPLSLATLNAEGRLTQPISTTAAVIPGDPTAQAALGYLHANCGPCHNGAGAPPVTTPAAPLRFWVAVGTTSVNATPAYVTAVGQPATTWTLPTATLRIAPHDSTDSMVIQRMMQRGLVGDSGVSYQMPPLATDIVDSNGVSAVSAWIASLP